MSLKNTLTNEDLTKKFSSPFALVTHAIDLVRAQVGREEEIDTNIVNDTLEYIAYREEVEVPAEEE